MFGDKYRFKKKISEGAFGHIYLAKSIDGIKVAIKKIEKTEKNIGRIKNDAEIPKLMNHESIIKVIDYYEIGEFAHIVYPYVKYSITLSEFEKKIFTYSENAVLQKIMNIFCQLCDIIEFMHGHGVIHRDLKPDNILLVNDDKTPIVLDFDLSFVINNDKYPSYNNICGSPSYLAPEMWKQLEDSSTVDYKLGDIYSLGVMLYRICNSRQMPYKASSLKKLYFSILNDAPKQSDSGITELDELIMKLIQKCPNDRPPIKEIQSALQKIKNKKI